MLNLMEDMENSMITGWKDLFQTHILERGLNYFESGAVDSLEKTEEGYRATVAGSDIYQVEIEVHDHHVYDMFCDCPYARAGNYCKHMAAVLYEIEEGKGEAPFSTNFQEQIDENRKELEDVVSKIPEGELRRLLITLAWEDESLRNRILTRYSETIDARQMIRLKREVDEIAYQNSDRYGFVDYYHASDYTDGLNAFLYEKVQALIDKKCLMQAFELTNYVFYCVGNQDMDDSDGGTGWIADTCYDFWKEILDESREEEKTQMFQWFQEHQTGYVIDYMEEYINDFLMNEFHDPDMLRKKLKALDELIEKAGSCTDCGESYSARYGYENNIIKRLQLMKELGCTEQEIKEYRDRFRRFSTIRKLEIEDYLNKKQYEKAIEVLKESKNLDGEYAGLVAEYSRRLIEIYTLLRSTRSEGSCITGCSDEYTLLRSTRSEGACITGCSNEYEKTGRQIEYREELEYQVFTCAQSNLEYIKKLKEAYDQKEWPQCREKILASRTVWSVKYDFLESEGLYERLLCEIKDNGSVYVLDRYEKILKKKYPEAVRDMYIAYIMQQAERVSDRKSYRGLVGYLKKIKMYPEGQNKVREIAGEWRVLYKRRPAMMDELKKAGF